MSQGYPKYMTLPKNAIFLSSVHPRSHVLLLVLVLLRTRDSYLVRRVLSVFLLMFVWAAAAAVSGAFSFPYLSSIEESQFLTRARTHIHT